MAFRSSRAVSINFRQFGGPGGGRVLQRRCACGNKAESEGTCDECAEKEGTLQRKSHSGRTGEAPSIVYDVLRTPGQPLETESRNLMEDHFGFDFSGVRVHTDEQAHRSAEATDAYAYTVGQDVVFASGRYSPNTSAGRELLAHELTHVVQQDSAPASSSGAITMGKQDEHEAAADQTATAVTSNNTITPAIGPASLGLQRQPAEEGVSGTEATEGKPAERPCLEEVVGEDVPSLLQAGVLTVIEFGGTSCKPCQRLKAHLAEICQNFRVNAPPVTVRFYSLDLEVAGNEDLYDKYVPGGSIPHLYFFVGSTEKSHYDSAPEPDVLERMMADHIKYASTSGAARGAKKGLGWGALAGGLAGIGGAIAIGTQTNLEGNALMGGILGSIFGGAAVGLGLGAAIGAIAGAATDDRDKGPKEQKRKKLQKKARSGGKDDEQERQADQTAQTVAEKKPDLPKTRGARAGTGAGIGAGIGVVAGGIAGLIAASQMKDTPYGAGAGVGAAIGGAVGALIGGLIGYFMGYDEKVTNAGVADGLIRRVYGKYMPGGVGPLNNASVHLVTKPEICEKNACRKGKTVDPACGLLGWTDTGPVTKPSALPKDQPAPIKAEDEPTCANNKPLEHATRDRPVIYYTTDEASGTLIHEGLHAYADQGIEMLHNHVNEGLTEYFARKVESDINMPHYHNDYDPMVANVEKMIGLIGENKFAEAYFGRGKVPALHQAVNSVLGPCALITWAFNLNMNSDMRADEILANRNVNYCKSKEIPMDATPGDLTPAVEPASQPKSTPTKQQPKE